MPVVLQMEAAECGVACLSMILAHFGRSMPLEILRSEGTSGRDGISAADIVALASKHGLASKAYSVEPEHLASIPLPQILFWEFNHFVVLERVLKNRFVIFDPAVGRRVVSAAEFGRSFTGITLSFEKKPDFQATKRRPGVVHFLAERLRGSPGAFSVILLSHFLLAIIAILMPGFLRIFIDDYLVQHHTTWLIPLLLAIAAIGLVRVALLYLSNYAGLLLQTKLSGAMSAEFVWRLLRLPFRFFASRSAAEMSSRVQLTNQVVGTLNGPAISLLVGSLTLLIQMAAMAAYSVNLMLCAVIFAVLNMFLLYHIQYKITEISQQMQLATGRAHAANIQGMSLLEDHKATGTGSLLFERMMQAHIELVNAEQRSGAVQKRLEVLSFVGREGFSIAILFVGALEVMNSHMSIGMLVGFQMLAEMFGTQLAAMIGLGTAVQTAAGPIGRLRDILDHAVEAKTEINDPERVARLAGTIETKNLAFSYSPAHPVIKDISVQIDAGQIVAIIGPTGGGKTTFMRLLLGMFTPLSGEVLIGGQPLAETDSASLRATIGYVDQTSYLPSGRMHDGLSLWDTTITSEELKIATKTAKIDAVIASRPGGLDSYLGEEGGGFSGGERQRLAIARALTVSPSILFLDESTSGLDMPTEIDIFANLRERGITTLLISHRKDTLKHCDRVLVISDGKLAWDGAPAYLPEHFARADVESIGIMAQVNS